MRNRHKFFLTVSSGIFIPLIVFERLETTFLVVSAMFVLFLAEIGLSTAVVCLSNSASAAVLLNEIDERTGLRNRTILSSYLSVGLVYAVCGLSLAVLHLGLSHAVPLPVVRGIEAVLWTSAAGTLLFTAIQLNFLAKLVGCTSVAKTKTESA